MVKLKIEDEKLILEVQGMDKLWAFKGNLEIPLAHITAVRADSEAASKWWQGLKLPGTNLPGVIKAGTFYERGKRVFWDIHHPENGIVIGLADDEKYKELIVEVANPSLAVEQIEAALRRFDPVQEAGEESFPASDPPAY